MTPKCELCRESVEYSVVCEECTDIIIRNRKRNKEKATRTLIPCDPMYYCRNCKSFTLSKDVANYTRMCDECSKNKP